MSRIPRCRDLKRERPHTCKTDLELSARTITAAAVETATSRRSFTSSGLPCRNTKVLPWRASGGICRLPQRGNRRGDFWQFDKGCCGKECGSGGLLLHRMHSLVRCSLRHLDALVNRHSHRQQLAAAAEVVVLRMITAAEDRAPHR